jgi:hypothetical protein
MRAWVRRGRTVVTAVSMMGLCCARSALAQLPQGGNVPDASSPPESMRTVDVTIVAGGEDADPLMGTIRELLGRLGLGVEPHLVAAPSAAGEPAGPAGLSVWIDLASRYEAVAIVRRGRMEVRRTIARDSSPAIVREEIGEAVRSAVEAQLLSDAASSPPAPAVAAPLPPPGPAHGPETPPASTSSNRWFALDLTLLAGGGPVADGSGFVPRVGGGVVIGSRRRLRPSLTVTATYVVPFESPLSNVTTRTTFVSLRAVPAIEVLHTSWLAVNVGAGGGVDIISVDPSTRADATAIQVKPQIANRVDPIVTALATAYLALAPGVALTLVAGTDVDFVPPVYAVAGPGGGDILSPWRVRPVALAGFTFTAVGNELFAARAP